MARTLVLDTKKQEIRLTECKCLNDFYRELDAQPFDIVTRPIDGKLFDIFVDDCGLYRENPVVSAIDSEGNPMLVGNLVIANHDKKGNTTSLSDDDIKKIRKSIYWAKKKDGKTNLVIMFRAREKV